MNPMPASTGVLVDRIAASFEHAWHSDERRTIEELLAQHSEVPVNVLLFELLMVEFELRATAGESLDPTDYLWRFADEKDTVLLAQKESGLGSANCHPTVSQIDAETKPRSGSAADGSATGKSGRATSMLMMPTLGSRAAISAAAK